MQEALYKRISEEIEYNQENDSLELPRKHSVKMMTLYCLRTGIIEQLMQAGLRGYTVQLEEDIDVIIDYVREIEDYRTVTDDILIHAKDLLCAVWPEYKKQWTSFFRKRFGRRIRRNSDINTDLYYLFVSVSVALEESGRREVSLNVLERLCQMSKESGDKTYHRELLTRVFCLIDNRDPQRIVQIARENLKLFLSAKGEYEADFFWYFACALHQLQQYDEAISYYEYCYDIRRVLYGERDWYTVVARREYSILKYTLSRDEETEAYLYSFVNQIEAGDYPQIDRNLLKTLQGKTLYTLLAEFSDSVGLSLYDKYLRIYEDICESYNDTLEPLLKMRIALNLRGGYFLQKGDFIQAEEAFIRAMQVSIPEGVPEVLSIPLIKSNLLIAYYVQNDMEMAVPLVMELVDALQEDESRTGFTERDEYRIYALLASIESANLVEPAGVEKMKSLLNELCRDIINNPSDLPECTGEIAVFLICSMQLMLQFQLANIEEQKLYLEALDLIEKDSSLFPLSLFRHTLVSYIAALLAWNTQDSRVAEWFARTNRLCEQAMMPMNIKAAILGSYASFLAESGKKDDAIMHASQVSELLEKMWQSSVKYLNDDRLLNMLTNAQIQFWSCYTVFRNMTSSDVSYEKILQFKALASRAAKERNRVIQLHRTDDELIIRIREAQDRLAILQTEEIFRETADEFEREQQALRRMEAQFAQQFPDNCDFVSVTWEYVQTAIPDDSVVIEYFYNTRSYFTTQYEANQQEADLGLDVYVTQKRSGICRLERLTISDAVAVCDQADEFVEILQAESNQSISIRQIERKDDLRTFLYKKLIEPVLPFVDSFEKIYIAPDYNLVNLPFDILYDENRVRLEDGHTVILLECARDFLYKTGSVASSKGELIIGNPKFELKEKELESLKSEDIDGQSRRIYLDAGKITELPFSEIEAELVGQRCESDYYIGLTASKQLLLNAQGYRNIHIATHGFFDLSDEATNGMFSSCLLFAGVSNWLKDGKVSTTYGNGILTADEVSRLDLRSVELVVLSSCLSGMSDSWISKSFRGMTGAFAAAGSHYVLSHLWEANDFSTLILMDAFYYYYIDGQYAPPEALSKAKHYLQHMTIGDLKKKPWFAHARKMDLDVHTIQLISRYEQMDEQVRPFKSEAYWGGFVCNQCY